MKMNYKFKFRASGTMITAFLMSVAVQYGCDKPADTKSDQVATDVGKYLPSQDSPPSDEKQTAEEKTTVSGQDLKVRSLEIEAQDTVMALGNSQDLRALAIFSDDSRRFITPAVTWTTDATDIADFSKDPASPGRLTSKKIGKVKVKGTFQTASTELEITITEAQIQSVEVYPKTFLVGVAQQFSAKAIYSNGVSNTLNASGEWRSSDASLFYPVLNQPNGTFLALAPRDYSLTINAGSVNLSAIVKATIPEFKSIELVSGPVSINLGSSQQLQANGILFDNSKIDITQAVNWVSSKPASLTVTSETGKAGIVKAVGAGSASISAAIISEGRTLSAAKDFSVTTVEYKSIRITGTEKPIPLFYKKSLKAIGTLASGVEVDITADAEWSSEDVAILTISNIIPGEVLAKGIGKTKVTAKYGKASVTNEVTVVDVSLIELTAVKPPTTIQCGDGKPIFTVKGKMSDGSDSPDIMAVVKWFSSDPDVATISNDPLQIGLLTSTQPGTVTVTVKYFEQKTGETIEDSVDVTIGSPVLKGYNIVAPKYMRIGETKQITAVGKYSCRLGTTTAALTDQLTWAVSSSDYAKFSTTTKGSLKAARTGGATALSYPSVSKITVTAKKDMVLADCADGGVGGCLIEIRPREVVLAQLSYPQDGTTGDVLVDVGRTKTPTLKVGFTDDAPNTYSATLSPPFQIPGHSFSFAVVSTVPSNVATASVEEDTGIISGLAIGSAMVSVAVLTPSSLADTSIPPVAHSTTVGVSTLCEGAPVDGDPDYDFKRPMRFRNYCFYLGKLNASCVDACTLNGRTYDPAATETVIGGATTGAGYCKALISNPIYFGSLVDDWPDQNDIPPATPSQGVGCSITTGTIFGQRFSVPYYYGLPNPISSAALPNINRLCGCK